MKNLILFIAVVTLLSLVGCAQRYYLKNNLNQITIGQTKEKTLAMFPKEQSAAGAREWRYLQLNVLATLSCWKSAKCCSRWP